MKARTIIAAALLSATSTLADAQTPSSTDPHHPPQDSSQNATPAPTQPASPSTQGSAGGQQNMMGGGMMPQGGMMGQGGMMDGGSTMMGMMSAGTSMMGTGQASTCSGDTCGMGGMATIDHVEGRIAFLKTELKVTDAQNDTWNAFADTLRDNARKLGELRGTMTPQGALGDRLAWQEKWLTARAENTRSIRTAYADLAAKLSDEQKKTAEQLLAPHVGMMSGMDGQMMDGRMGMGMGNMNFGQMPMMPGNPMTSGRAIPEK